MIGMPFFAKNRPRLITTGGTVTTIGWDKIHTFTSNGTFTCNGTGYIQYLIVGGGGGGGKGYSDGTRFYSGEGGHGGQVLYNALYKISAGSFAVVIGGDKAGTANRMESTGNNTSIFSITANGSGGALGGDYVGVTGFSYENGKAGSNGTSNSISGTTYVYASGAGSGATGTVGQDRTGGSGGTGAGKGGNAVATIGYAGENGTNYGAGGGGGGCVYASSYGGGDGGTGKQGIIIIRYRRV